MNLGKNLDISSHNKGDNAEVGVQVEHWDQVLVLPLTFSGMSFTSLGLSFLIGKISML